MIENAKAPTVGNWYAQRRCHLCYDRAQLAHRRASRTGSCVVKKVITFALFRQLISIPLAYMRASNATKFKYCVTRINRDGLSVSGIEPMEVGRRESRKTNSSLRYWINIESVGNDGMLT